MGCPEAAVGARLQQFATSERKSSVANIPVIMKLRPRSADIIEGEKVRAPGVSVSDEAVPLNEEAMLRLDVLVQLP